MRRGPDIAPTSWTAERSRDAYLAENGWTLEAYDAPRAPVSLFFLHFSIPNTESRRRVVRRHDLHHIVTGFGTDLAGEAEISAWEARRGLRGVAPYVAALVISVALLGLVIAPRRTIRAWRAAAGNRGSLFNDETSYEELLGMTVGELRERLGVPAEGIASVRALHDLAPRAV